jgi:hypothetical protein
MTTKQRTLPYGDDESIISMDGVHRVYVQGEEACYQWAVVTSTGFGDRLQSSVGGTLTGTTSIEYDVAVDTSTWSRSSCGDTIN